ncbi:MAG: hypothetical protein WBL25_08640 [Anaerolineales bacterium]
MSENFRLWLARGLIALVMAWNLQAALVFILWPERFAPGFELSGVPGAAAVRGTGFLFLMWNVPYLVALWHPQEYRLALGLALVMQSIGLVGESLILLALPDGHALLRGAILRFIAFDGGGLLLLAATFWLVRNKQNRKV